jgi:mannonate dehydratase
MKRGISRRRIMQIGGAAALAPYAALTETAAEAQQPAQTHREWPILEGEGTPKMCVGTSRNADDAQMRQIKQLGVDHVLMGGPRLPWDEAELRAVMQRFQDAGLTVVNMMIGGFPRTIYGEQGRDEEIGQVQESLRAAGNAGLPVVEYNFYAHRLTEGYYEVEGRGGAGYTGFDYDRVKDLPPQRGTYTAEQLWDNLAYFLKAVVPVAEHAGVRMALHPNDPPVPTSRGSAQIMATFDDWKRLIEIVDSPANGVTYDCGVTRETGADPALVCRYFGSRDRINHVHFRNVVVETPYLKYVEVFPDEGQADMFAVMRELVSLQYDGAIYPEHPRALDYDREREGFDPYYPGGGEYAGLAYNVAHARGMLQAALSLANG